MKLNLYSIFDTVAQVFHKPFTEVNNDTAIRVFTHSIKDNESKNDYVLYYLGEFLDHNGEIIPIKAPLKCLSGFDITLKESETPESLKQQAV